MARKPAAHRHVCDQCGESYSCTGTLEENYDGFPEVICVAYHERGERTCEACAGVEA